MPGTLHNLQPLQDLARQYAFSSVVLLPRVAVYEGRAVVRLKKLNPAAVASSVDSDLTKAYLNQLKTVPESVFQQMHGSFAMITPSQRWWIHDSHSRAQSALNSVVPEAMGKSMMIASIITGADWEQGVILLSHRDQDELHRAYTGDANIQQLVALSTTIHAVVQDLQRLYAYRLNPYTAFGNVSVRESLCVSRLAQGVPESVVCEELSIKSTRYLVDNFKIKLGLASKADAIRFALRQGLVP